MKSSILVLLIIAFCTANIYAATGKFWHISDLHLDFYYNLDNSSSQKACPSSYGKSTINAGPWGDYRCDSPMKLIKSAINAMVDINDKPDFIFWTGDDVLHTNNETKYLSEDLVLQVISNLTELIQNAFPNTTVFSALGNHDYYLKNQFPAAPNNIISSVANMWRPWLNEDQYRQFNITGYYIKMVPGFPYLHVIVLNTNIWYHTNREVNGTGDPNNHFKWFEEQLSEIRQKKSKTFIIGHIPPGYYDLSFDVRFYYKEYNERFISIIQNYHDVIVGQFFGHHHTDNFRMFYNKNGDAISSLLLTPAITPWISSYLDASGNNPGIRLFEFDTTSFLLTDYVQYYLNLTQANEQHFANWSVEYRATEAYKIPNLSTAFLQILSERLKNADVNCTECSDNILLQDFNLYTTVSFNQEYCDTDCQRRQVCAIQNLGTDNYQKCISGQSVHVSAKGWMMYVCGLVSYLLSQI